MSYKYSVIIPVYKAQDTLRRCVDSLLNQNCIDAELVLVNDGSPDDCGKICEEYAKNYPQVKYIEKENGGVSSARNAGIDAACGTYIMFVDSDDYVSENYFREIDKALEEYDWDYLLFSDYITDGNTVRKRIDASYSACSSEDIATRIAKEIHDTTINGPVAKVYKRQVIIENSIRYNEKVSISEDWAFNVKYALGISNIRRIGSPLYYVSIENNASLSRRVICGYYEQHCISTEEVRCAIKNSKFGKDEKARIVAEVNFGDYRAIYTNAKIQHRQGMKFTQRIKAIRAMCRELNARKLKIPKTRFCRLISLPVKLNCALTLDIIAWALVHR